MDPKNPEDLPAIAADVADLRFQAYQENPWFLATESNRNFLRTRAAQQLAPAQSSGTIEIFGKNSKIRAYFAQVPCLASSENPRPESSESSVELHLDYRPGDLAALAWVRDHLEDFLSRTSKPFSWTLPHSYRELLASVDEIRCHRASRFFLLGLPALEVALTQAHPKQVFPSQSPLILEKIQSVEELEIVMNWKEAWFRAQPWYSSHEDIDTFLASQRSWLEAAFETESSLALLAKDQGHAIGFCAVSAFDSPLSGRSIQVDAIHHPDCRGQGLTRSFLPRIFAWAKTQRVRAANFGTAQPAAAHLALRVPKSTLSWKVRSGPSPFSKGHFSE